MDGNENELMPIIPIGYDGHADIATNTKTHTIYVTNSKSNSVSVIDGINNKLVTDILVETTTWH